MTLGTVHVLRWACCRPNAVLAALAFGLTVGAPAPHADAGSYATAYDMDIFLNESHPFDIAPTAGTSNGVETAQTIVPVPGPGLSTAAEGESLDDFDDLDGLDDLTGDGQAAADNDPIEPVNRFIFGFNQIVEDIIFRPIAYTYNAVMPDIGKTAVSNVLDNLSSPVVLANDLMQGEFARGWETVQRMAINTTVGVGGLWDAAAWMGIEEHREDFGQTLAVWGVGEGFYLVLPLLGPSNPRDAIGQFGVDNFLDPVGLWLDNTDREEWGYARLGAAGFVRYADVVDDLDNLRDTSIDYYAAIRSLYRQKRAAEIANNDSGRPADDLDYDVDEF